MKKILLGYFIFTLALIAALLLFPTFFLMETLAVCIAFFTVIKFLRVLSALILSLITVLTTAVWPIFILFMIGKDSGLSLLHYFTLTDVVSFVLPTCTVIALITLTRKMQYIAPHAS